MILKDKHIVLTGASGGIGAALAQQLAEQGATLVLMGRSPAPLYELQKQLPGEHTVLTADLNQSYDRDKVISLLADAGHPIDLLINNAGISGFSLLADMDEQHIAAIVQSNLLSPMLFTRKILPLLNPDAAQVVNIGSTFGSIGYPGFTAYCASKFGLRGFSEALSRELTDTNTRVLHISPRATQTLLNTTAVSQLNQKLGNRCDSPGWVAQQICCAINNESKFKVLGWPEKLIVPLNNLCRAVVDKVIQKQLPIIKKFALEN